MPDSPTPGLYDSLKTSELAAAIEGSDLNEYAEALSSELSHERLSAFLAQQLSQLLSGISGTPQEKILAQATLVNDLLVHLRSPRPSERPRPAVRRPIPLSWQFNT